MSARFRFRRPQVFDRFATASGPSLPTLVAALLCCTGCLSDPAGVESTSPRQGFDAPAAPDTLRFQAFGQTAALPAAPPVYQDGRSATAPPAVTGLVIADTAIAELTDSGRIRARGNGVTSVRFVATEVMRQVMIVVEQVPKSLTVATNTGSLLVAVPVGAALSLTCQVLDANQHSIARDSVVLVRSARGTVAGTRCDDERVRSAGYDTLFFAAGDLQAALPVLIAAAPDSVGILAAARPLTTVQRDSFVGENLAEPLILALRPLVADILTAYGNPASALDRARAVRDWVARTAIHPYQPLHPTGSSSNLSVLPPGSTWDDVNSISMSKIEEDAEYWGAVGMNGYAMLDRLLGTLDPVGGQRADDGLMVHVAGARYQIRDIASYRYVLCSYQDIMLNALWAAAGLHGMLISTIGHDPAAVFIADLGRWVYEDPEWDEEYFLGGTGEPLSPADLLALSSAGEAGRFRAMKLPGPSFDPEVYVAGDTYLAEGHADGFVVMGSQLNNRVVGSVVAGDGDWPVRDVQIDVSRLDVTPPFDDAAQFARVGPQDAFPTLGVVVQGLRVEDSVYVAQLGSTFPNHQRFERRANGGPWVTVGALDVLPVGVCRVEYRSMDAEGNTGASTVMDVWLPRAPGFIESGVARGMRNRSQYCSEP